MDGSHGARRSLFLLTTPFCRSPLNDTVLVRRALHQGNGGKQPVGGQAGVGGEKELVEDGEKAARVRLHALKRRLSQSTVSGTPRDAASDADYSRTGTSGNVPFGPRVGR